MERLFRNLCRSSYDSSPWNRRFRPCLEILEDRTVPSTFEVWTIDQSNTRDETGNGSVLDTLDSGGTLYIYQGDSLSGQDADIAIPEVIDLGGAARDFSVAMTGTAPRRPHMMVFNTAHSHAVIACVASGHVLFLDALTRQTVGVIDVGAQAHAAFVAPDDSYVIVANQNGKLLHRIWTDYATNTFTLDAGATLDLANGLTPNGALRQDPVLRPDNAPICPVIESSGQFTFVTLRGGGLFVVDSTATPMQIVAEYDRTTVHKDGCGGIENNGKVYINSGGPGESDLYAFPLSGFDATPNAPNLPAPNLIFSEDGGAVDSHGTTLTKHGRYLWVGDRFANKINVVDMETDTLVNQINLAGSVSGDPAPDLMDISPSGNRVFIALRGPNPLTGNNPAFNNAVGSTPGVGVMHVTHNGRSGRLHALAPITHMIGGIERADPHTLRVRRIESASSFTLMAEQDSDLAVFLVLKHGTTSLTWALAIDAPLVTAIIDALHPSSAMQETDDSKATTDSDTLVLNDRAVTDDWFVELDHQLQSTITLL